MFHDIKNSMFFLGTSSILLDHGAYNSGYDSEEVVALLTSFGLGLAGQLTAYAPAQAYPSKSAGKDIEGAAEGTEEEALQGILSNAL